MPNSFIEPPVRPTPAEQLSFLSVLNFCLRHFLVLLLPGLVLSGLLLVRMLRAPRSYTATATFSAGDAEAGGARFLGLSLPGVIAGKGAQFYVDLIESPAILNPLVERKFQVAPGSPPQTLVDYYGGTAASRPLAKELAMEAMAKRIHWKITPTSGWVILSVTAESPSLSADLAKAILAQIDSFNTDTRKAQSLADREFAYARLTEVGADVRSAEDALQHFLETNRDIQLSPSLQIERERLTNTVATRRALYSTILQTYDREKMDSQRDTKLLTIIGPPTVPLAPDRQVSARLTLMGFVIGLFLGGLIAVSREYFRRMKEDASPEYREFAELRSRITTWMRRPFRRGARA